MTPTELFARISAIIPPPRSPLIRFHGVFAPNFPRRAEVVPTGREPERSQRGVRQASFARLERCRSFAILAWRSDTCISKPRAFSVRLFEHAMANRLGHA